mmetsp:Transcript_4311/g.6460  ORF Transcript_4311/g.6460 Transcript_4311/m.6460 type:complete len:265 (-) Transcript_4311:72-866(-)
MFSCICRARARSASRSTAVVVCCPPPVAGKEASSSLGKSMFTSSSTAGAVAAEVAEEAETLRERFSRLTSGGGSVVDLVRLGADKPFSLPRAGGSGLGVANSTPAVLSLGLSGMPEAMSARSQCSCFSSASCTLTAGTPGCFTSGLESCSRMLDSLCADKILSRCAPSGFTVSTWLLDAPLRLRALHLLPDVLSLGDCSNRESSMPHFASDFAVSIDTDKAKAMSRSSVGVWHCGISCKSLSFSFLPEDLVLLRSFLARNISSI